MSLDSSFQDNSYLKNYMTYDMMSFMGVPSPLCSYVRVTVNGEDWGLFLLWKSLRRHLPAGISAQITVCCINLTTVRLKMLITMGTEIHNR